MKKFTFELVTVQKNRTVELRQTEEFECAADAMVRARKIMAECRRDNVDVLQINVFECKHIISYQ